jgi:hypothetical protein
MDEGTFALSSRMFDVFPKAADAGRWFCGIWPSRSRTKALAQTAFLTLPSKRQIGPGTTNDPPSYRHVWDVHRRPYGPHRMGAVSLCAVLLCTRGVKVGDAELRMVVAMSALPPKADVAKRDWDVRFVPKADIRDWPHRSLAEGTMTV